MNKFKIGEAAHLLGVSSDMVRRWVDSGEIDAHRTHGGHRLINGDDLAKFAQNELTTRADLKITFRRETDLPD